MIDSDEKAIAATKAYLDYLVGKFIETEKFNFLEKALILSFLFSPQGITTNYTKLSEMLSGRVTPSAIRNAILHIQEENLIEISFLQENLMKFKMNFYTSYLFEIIKDSLCSSRTHGTRMYYSFLFFCSFVYCLILQYDILRISLLQSNPIYYRPENPKKTGVLNLALSGELHNRKNLNFTLENILENLKEELKESLEELSEKQKLEFNSFQNFFEFSELFSYFFIGLSSTQNNSEQFALSSTQNNSEQNSIKKEESKKPRMVFEKTPNGIEENSEKTDLQSVRIKTPNEIEECQDFSAKCEQPIPVRRKLSVTEKLKLGAKVEEEKIKEKRKNKREKTPIVHPEVYKLIIFWNSLEFRKVLIQNTHIFQDTQRYLRMLLFGRSNNIHPRFEKYSGYNFSILEIQRVFRKFREFLRITSDKNYKFYLNMSLRDFIILPTNPIEKSQFLYFYENSKIIDPERRMEKDQDEFPSVTKILIKHYSKNYLSNVGMILENDMKNFIRASKRIVEFFDKNKNIFTPLSGIINPEKLADVLCESIVFSCKDLPYKVNPAFYASDTTFSQRLPYYLTENALVFSTGDGNWSIYDTK